jgi:NAD(P)-dependent dehydrogenase (short-subunit alcohol dehydrogenase family)
MGLLDGRVALVTASSGSALPRDACNAQGQPSYSQRAEEQTQAVASGRSPRLAAPLVALADVSDSDQVQALVRRARRVRRLDCAVNNAGSQGQDDSGRDVDERWDNGDTNLRGVFLCEVRDPPCRGERQRS